MKKILILGGTQFIGRNLVERLQGMDEYKLTLFNRQKTKADLFPGIDKIKGDRQTSDINKIAGEDWDFVIDLSCYYPDSLKSVLNSLTPELNKYIFVSTCSVYKNENKHLLVRDEQSKILPCNDDQRKDHTTSTYGNRKAECERILKDSGINHIILRPALVYGTYDYTDRFYYWLYQVRHKDRLLLPDNGDGLFSITYVEDLTNTIILTLTRTTKHRVYNAITVPKASIGQIVDCAKELLDKDLPTLNASSEFLNQQNISQWTDMPLWVDGDNFTYNNQLLQDDFNIELTAFKDSVKKTLDYYHSINWPEPNYGMTNLKREELIDKIVS